MTDARSPMRALRAAAFAAVCVTLTALGHSFTSGHEVPVGALLTAFGVTGAGAWFAGGRRHGFRSLAAGLLTVQGALHLIFAGALPYGISTAPHTRHTGTADADMNMGERPLMAMDMAGDEGEPALLSAVTGGPVTMVAAHLLAGAVCALWLARGEAALFRLAHALGALAFTPLRLLLTPSRLPAVPRPVPLGAGEPSPHRFRGVVLAHSVSRRGPPVLRAPHATDPGTALALAA